jgi:hypothetical protein
VLLIAPRRRTSSPTRVGTPTAREFDQALQRISNGNLAVGRFLRLAQASSPGVIDDGIRPLIQISWPRCSGWMNRVGAGSMARCAGHIKPRDGDLDSRFEALAIISYLPHAEAGAGAEAALGA